MPIFEILADVASLHLPVYADIASRDRQSGSCNELFHTMQKDSAKGIARPFDVHPPRTQGTTFRISLIPNDRSRGRKDISMVPINGDIKAILT